MKSLLLIQAVFMAGLGMGTAQAEIECNVPMSDWQPRNVVQAMAKQKGWTVQRLKTDDGCYVIKGRDDAGKEIFARIDPATMEILEITRHADDDDDHGTNPESDDSDSR